MKKLNWDLVKKNRFRILRKGVVRREHFHQSGAQYKLGASAKEKRKQISLIAKLGGAFSAIVVVVGLLAAIEPMRDLFMHVVEGSLFEKQYKGLMFDGGLSVNISSDGGVAETLDEPIASLTWSWNANVRRAANLLKAPDTRRDGLMLLAQNAKSEKELLSLYFIASRLDLTIAADAALKLMEAKNNKWLKDIICFGSADTFMSTWRETERDGCLNEFDSASILEFLAIFKKIFPQISDLSDSERSFLATSTIALMRDCVSQSAVKVEVCSKAWVFANPEPILKQLLPSKAPSLVNIIKLLMKAGDANRAGNWDGLSMLSNIAWQHAPDVMTARRVLASNAVSAATDLDQIEGNCREIGPVTADACSRLRRALNDCREASLRFTSFDSPDALATEMKHLLANLKDDSMNVRAQLELRVAKNAAALWGQPNPQLLIGSPLGDTPEAKIKGQLRGGMLTTTEVGEPITICVGSGRTDISFSAVPALAQVLHEIRTWEMGVARGKGGIALYNAFIDHAWSAIGESDYQSAISAYQKAISLANDLIQPRLEISSLGHLADIYRVIRDPENYEATMQRRATVAAEFRDVNGEVATYSEMRDQFSPFDPATRDSAIDVTFHSMDRALKWGLAAINSTTRVGNAMSEVNSRQAFAFLLCMAGRDAEADAQQQLVRQAAGRLKNPGMWVRVADATTCASFKSQHPQ